MANKKSMAEKLADLIETNPTCRFHIDNDNWQITLPPEVIHNDEEEDENISEIAESGEYYWDTNWYSHSNQYGVGLAEAMVILLNRRGFNIKASAV
jgi:hypothetical protein